MECDFYNSCSLLLAWHDLLTLLNIMFCSMFDLFYKLKKLAFFLYIMEYVCLLATVYFLKKTFNLCHISTPTQGNCCLYQLSNSFLLEESFSKNIVPIHVLDLTSHLLRKMDSWLS